MANIEVSVSVEKEAYEFGQGLAKFVGAVKQALADGFEVGQDLPPIIASAVADLLPAMQDIDKLDTADRIAFSKALALTVADVADVFVD